MNLENNFFKIKGIDVLIDAKQHHEKQIRELDEAVFNLEKQILSLNCYHVMNNLISDDTTRDCARNWVEKNPITALIITATDISLDNEIAHTDNEGHFVLYCMVMYKEKYKNISSIVKNKELVEKLDKFEKLYGNSVFEVILNKDIELFDIDIPVFESINKLNGWTHYYLNKKYIKLITLIDEIVNEDTLHFENIVENHLKRNYSTLWNNIVSEQK